MKTRFKCHSGMLLLPPVFVLAGNGTTSHRTDAGCAVSIRCVSSKDSPERQCSGPRVAQVAGVIHQ